MRKAATAYTGRNPEVGSLSLMAQKKTTSFSLEQARTTLPLFSSRMRTQRAVPGCSLTKLSREFEGPPSL